MNSRLMVSLLSSFNHNIVFGALVGLETIFLVARAPKQRLLPMWCVLLPLLCAGAWIDHRMIAMLHSSRYEYLFPFLATVVAAAGASLVIGIKHRTDGKEPNLETDFLVYASIAALLMALPWWTPVAGGARPWLSSALDLWVGYGTALVSFASLGPRLFNRGSPSGLLRYALFLTAVVIIAIAFSGMHGLQPIVYQK